jgi:hypothetical protein
VESKVSCQVKKFWFQGSVVRKVVHIGSIPYVQLHLGLYLFRVDIYIVLKDNHSENSGEVFILD